ncbi:uncharacterized protein LOC131671117, partial [Phymastichus coffea]|uniref:uncharacterized protein LOC131671117 n=1 Tax=Phymastichus coffea TaxID=108790 RepID=UPI00273B79C8
VKQRKVEANVSVAKGLRKLKRPRVQVCKKVLRMLSQEQSSGEPRPEASGATAGCSNGAEAAAAFITGEGSEEFLSTGRTGRRNAMPDILGQHAETATGDLPQKLEALTTEATRSSQPGEAGQSQQQPTG